MKKTNSKRKREIEGNGTEGKKLKRARKSAFGDKNLLVIQKQVDEYFAVQEIEGLNESEEEYFDEEEDEEEYYEASKEKRERKKKEKQQAKEEKQRLKELKQKQREEKRQEKLQQREERKLEKQRLKEEKKKSLLIQKSNSLDPSEPILFSTPISVKSTTFFSEETNTQTIFSTNEGDLSSYEKERLENIKKNQEMLKNLFGNTSVKTTL